MKKKARVKEICTTGRQNRMESKERKAGGTLGTLIDEKRGGEMRLE